MVGLPSAISAVQEIATEVSPAPVQFKRAATAKHLKARLDWGEPALTIIDVRDRSSYNRDRITGAVSVPLDSLVQTVGQMAELDRDIYLYGESEGDAINAATKLDQAGFDRVSVLEGGLPAWKAVKGATEGQKA